MADYNLYCHYVAGLVGIGLSHLFASSGGPPPPDECLGGRLCHAAVIWICRPPAVICH